MVFSTVRRFAIVSVSMMGLAACGSEPRGEGDVTSGEAATNSSGEVMSTSLTMPMPTGDTTAALDDDTSSTGLGESSSESTVAPGSSSESTAATESSSGSESSSGESSSTTGTSGVTIYDIQQGVVPLPSEVEVYGVVVTGTGGFGFFAQEPEGGQYSGIFVYAGAATAVSVGDVVDVTGIAQENMSMTQINVTMGSVNPTGLTGVDVEPAMPDLSVYAMEATAEPWEGVFVRAEAMPLTIENLPGFNEFDVGDGIDTVRIDNFLYNALADMVAFPGIDLGSSFTAIQGPLNFSFGAYKICPRNAVDLEGYVGPPPPPWTIVDALLPGDLVVTEVMYNPTCANDDCEWIEVYNATAEDVNLQGLRIQDSQLSAEGTIAAQVLVPPGGYAWLATDDAGGWPYAAQPSAFCTSCPALNNTTDRVVLLNATGIIDETANYTSVALGSGRSWKLDPTMLDAVSNDAAASWCYSTVVFDMPGMVSEYGSPGAENEAACAP